MPWHLSDLPLTFTFINPVELVGGIIQDSTLDQIWFHSIPPSMSLSLHLIAQIQSYFWPFGLDWYCTSHLSDARVSARNFDGTDPLATYIHVASGRINSSSFGVLEWKSGIDHWPWWLVCVCVCVYRFGHYLVYSKAVNWSIFQCCFFSSYLTRIGSNIYMVKMNSFC